MCLVTGDINIEKGEGVVPFPGLTPQMFVFPNWGFDLTGHPYLLQYYPGLTWLVITPTNFNITLVWLDWWSHLPTSILPWFELTADHTYQLQYYPGLTWLDTPIYFNITLVWLDWWSHLPTSILPWFDLTSDHTYHHTFQLQFFSGLTWLAPVSTSDLPWFDLTGDHT